MSTVVNITNPSVFFISANEPDFPLISWLHDPPGFFILYPSVPSRYWKLNGGSTDILEMTSGEKAVVDAAEIVIQTTNIRAKLVNEVDGILPLGVDIRSIIQLMNRRDNFLVNRIIELQNRVQAMLDSTGNVNSLRTDGLAVSISPAATRSRNNAIQDYKDDINAGVND